MRRWNARSSCTITASSCSTHRGRASDPAAPIGTKPHPYSGFFLLLLPGPLDLGSGLWSAVSSLSWSLLLRRARSAQSLLQTSAAPPTVLRAPPRSREDSPGLRFRRRRPQLRFNLLHHLQTSAGVDSLLQPSSCAAEQPTASGGIPCSSPMPQLPSSSPTSLAQAN